MGSLQCIPARREGGFPHGRVEHATHLGIPGVSATGKNHGLTGSDVYCVPPFIDIAIVPEALQAFARFRVQPWCVVGFDPYNSAREWLLTHKLVEVAMEHKLDAFFPR